MTQTTDVLIIGAGPTGLSLACQLIRYGIDFTIVEKTESVTHLSKALGVHARTLEVYEQLGIVDRAIDQGEIAGQVNIIAKGKMHEAVNLSAMGKGISPYPYMLVLEQSKNEKLLYEYLQQHNQQVRWNTTLEHFTQNETGVEAVVQDSNGEQTTIKAKYLVGCDGAKSPVRQGLDLQFLGDTFEGTFYVADTKLDWELPENKLYLCLSRDTFISFFPMKAERAWRIVGNLLNAEVDQEITYEDVEEDIKANVQIPFDVTEVNWFSSYRMHTRRVERFSQGRCFLAGDAAHVHTPAGGQGMNTGIQDAYNLAWKLALVLKGYAEPALLETYNEERLENAKNLVDSTDRVFEFQAGSDWFISFMRTVVFPPMAKHIFKIDRIQREIFKLVSQTGIEYSDSSLSDRFTSNASSSVKSGERMPYFQLDGQSIYQKLKQPMFHLITFNHQSEATLTVGEEMKSKYSEFIDFHALPLTPAVAKAFGFNQSFAVLLRPDNYIGLITDRNLSTQLEKYLSQSLHRQTMKAYAA